MQITCVTDERHIVTITVSDMNHVSHPTGYMKGDGTQNLCRTDHSLPSDKENGTHARSACESRRIITHSVT